MNQVQKTKSPFVTTAHHEGMQTLTPQEIAAVAGGPESGVGTGLNPPSATMDLAAQAMRLLSTVEINAVAGGPEGGVGTGMNPPNASEG